jgi:hypothetical protein
MCAAFVWDFHQKLRSLQGTGINAGPFGVRSSESDVVNCISRPKVSDQANQCGVLPWRVRPTMYSHFIVAQFWCRERFVS